MSKSNKLENLLACLGLIFIIVSLSVYLYFLGGIFRNFRILIVPLLVAAIMIIIASHLFWKISKKDIKFHWIFLLATPFIIFNFIGAMSPITDTDGAGYHLAIPKIYLQKDKFVYHPNVISNWPMSGEMLYVPMMYLGLPPKLIHFFFGIMLALLIYCIAKRYFDHKVAAWATVIAYTMPLVVLESGIAYVDLFFTFYIVFGLYYAYRAFDESSFDFAFSIKPSYWLLLLSSMFIGFGASIKWHGPIFVALAFLFVLISSSKGSLWVKRQSWKRVWWYPLPGIFFCGLWYLKNYLLSGAPFIPFTTGFNWSADNVALYMKTIAAPHISYLNNILYPFDSLTASPFKFGELTWIGPIFMAFLSIPVLVKSVFVDREKMPKFIKVMLLFSFIFYIIWLFIMPQSRLLLPVLVMLTIPIAWIIKKNKFYKAMIIISIISALPFAVLYNGQILDTYKGKILFKGDLIEQKIPAYPVYEWANEHLQTAYYVKDQNNKTVWERPVPIITLVYGDVHTYYLDVPYLWARPDMQGFITDYSKLKSYGITHVIIDDSKPLVSEGGFAELRESILKNNLTLLYKNNKVSLYEVR